MPKLTKRTIDSLKPREREYVAWDTEIKGFGARVRPSGRIVYILKYRVGGGRSGTGRKPTIGTHGSITADEARKIARDWMTEVAKGRDPGGKRKKDREASTVAEVCDRYLTEYAQSHKKASSVREDRRLIEKRIKPALGNKKVDVVTRADVRKFHTALSATPFEANRSLALFSKVMQEAEEWGLRPQESNPCRGTKRFPEPHRERTLDAAELSSLGRTLAKAEAEDSEPKVAIEAIRMLAFSGCRVGEILGLTWPRISIETGTARLADSKTGPRYVALGAPALELLVRLDRTGEWVFAVGKQPLAYRKLSDTWERVRGSAGLDDVRLHDLRHCYGTIAGGLGLNAFMIRDLLGHKTVATTARYVERDTDPMRAAADKVSGRVAAAMRGEQAEVVEMSKARR